MISFHNQVVRVRGIDSNTARSINTLDSVQRLVAEGCFKEIKTLPGINIYVNQLKVLDPREIMLVFKDGELVDQRLRRCV